MNQPLPPSNHNTQQAHQIHHHQQHHLPTTHQPAYPRTTVPDRRPQLFLTPPTTGCLRTTKPQQAVLHAEFAANPNPPGPKQQEIADRIGMKKSTVRNWFQVCILLEALTFEKIPFPVISKQPWII
ncbi:hypothetical protein BCR33DRAFT_711649 [Rhizoclosmatium globosum]|uniref:Homeobox domain-containing protein n=1 Tax=Rhizoclosmatium globosum TaxID=329046 RepID=A0A1Y2CZ39_9FUNG|nr:hypothetical protein BCR33DRAFT_711649 [Rhizoclosmatium globosum]|eukprot:ORY52312.1 hypothetical protein BCR33DRAFT_711649 [Rhizoclosmatium globosum]